MSEEHIWPEWMHQRLMPYIPDSKTTAGHFRARLSGTVVEEKTRQGHIFNKRYRLVCTSCNTTWMSGLETAAKPILLPLLDGDKTVLLKRDRQTLARWLTLKLMITECIDAQDAVVTQNERAAFRAARKIPNGLKIWIGTHSSPDWYAQYHHQTLLGTFGPLSSARERSPDLKNMQVTAIGIGHVFALFFISAFRVIKLKPYGGIIRLLWPIQARGLAWPLPELSAVDCNSFAHSLREIDKEPFVRWRPYSG